MGRSWREADLARAREWARAAERCKAAGDDEGRARALCKSAAYYERIGYTTTAGELMAEAEALISG